MSELPLPKDYLAAEFKRRLESNGAYTLRAFARDLSSAPARISEIFSGRQGISPKAALKFASKLQLSEAETQYFTDLCAAHFSRSPRSREHARERLVKREIGREGHNLTEDAFASIADWYHFAFLELLELKDFKNDVPWIANRLGLTENLVREVIERLLRLEMIVPDADRGYRASNSFTFSPAGVSSAAIKQSHRGLLEKASKALENDPIETRDFSSITFSVASERLSEATAELKEFRRNFARKYTNSAEKDSVYVLSLQMFRLDQGKQNV